jgi:hypothetical protein
MAMSRIKARDEECTETCMPSAGFELVTSAFGWSWS